MGQGLEIFEDLRRILKCGKQKHLSARKKLKRKTMELNQISMKKMKMEIELQSQMALEFSAINTQQRKLNTFARFVT
jgi:hypothetical protein